MNIYVHFTALMGCCCFFVVSFAKHEKGFDMSKYPTWFKENSEEGFYITGWEGGKKYGIFSFILSTSQGCSLLNHTSFSWTITFDDPDTHPECTISYTNNGVVNHQSLEYHSLPNPSCDDPYDFFKVVEIRQHPPGDRIVYCSNQSMFEEWYEFQNATRCYNSYMLLQLKQCSRLTTLRHLSSTCNIEVTKDKGGDGFWVDMNTNTHGKVQLRSNLFNRIETCNIECRLKIPKINELSVICPDQSEHKFELEEDLRKICYGVDVHYIRWLAIVACKISYHPYMIIVLLVWLMGSTIIFQLTCYLSSVIVDYMKSKLQNKIKRSLETGKCKYCCLPYSFGISVSRHRFCRKGLCPNCKGAFDEFTLPDHANSCQTSSDTLIQISNDVQQINKGTLLSRILLKVAVNDALCKLVKWVGTIVLMFMIFSPPLASALDTDPEMEIYQKHIEEVYGQEIIWHENVPSFSDELRTDLNICGENCLHSEGNCECPNDQYIKNLNSAERIKRDTNGMRHHTKDRNSKHKSKRVKKAEMKRNHFTLNMNHSDSQQVHLHQAKHILTNWGNFDITSDYQPSSDMKNLEVNWETNKKDKDFIYIKGTSLGKLDVYPGSGLTYEIASDDSVEKLIASLYIYDVSQVYKTQLKFVTGDRHVQTWFRGVCTGDCPTNCGCNTQTCVMKKWDYDRNLGCNPSWCWSTNSGCSCCAADITTDKTNWVTPYYDIEYVYTEAVICYNLGYDKFNCKVIRDNDQSTFSEFKFSFSKIYDIESLLPNNIALTWNLKKNDFNTLNLNQPDYVLLDPDICEHNCNHGEVGDVKFSSLFSYLGLIKNQTGRMSWVGVDIEHTCHFASWPDCEFYGLNEQNTESFQYLNDTSTHITDKFFLQKLTLYNDSSLDLHVRPYSNVGLMDVTLQVKNYGLKRKDSTDRLSSIKFKTCTGCFACISGFECTFTVKSKTHHTKRITFHVESDTLIVTITPMSYIFEPTSTNKIYKLFGHTPLNITQFDVHIAESPSVAATVEVELHEPSGLLVEHSFKKYKVTQSKKDCNGVFLALSCAGQNAFNSISTLGTGIYNGVWSWYNTFILIGKLVIGIILTFFVVKAVHLGITVLKMLGLITLLKKGLCKMKIMKEE